MSILLEYKLLTSFAFIIFAFLSKHYLIVLIRYRAKKKQKEHRSLTNAIKNISNLAVLILLFYLWSPELQDFAISIAAFMVAIVLATREFIQCFIGFLYITSTNPFRVGDWVQTKDHCGEVISTDWAKLTMLEVDIATYSYTGKTLFIPNNQLITSPIKNLNFLKRYVSHSFTITMNSDYQPYKYKAKLLKVAKKYCKDFQTVAERYNAIIERSLDVTIPGPEPEISITTTQMGRINTTFVIFCPTEKSFEIEEKLTEYFFNLVEASKQPINPDE
ncbi:mechanosensitive ion channel family protein [Marinicellulosiphila megalodicopiae]|uniref:mechanosensitive ion channel family protein n=1 Tax=Marinicellulosiphila megalodicopiae TaxID=2724896 RepID=UPI003BB1D356